MKEVKLISIAKEVDDKLIELKNKYSLASRSAVITLLLQELGIVDAPTLRRETV